MEQYTVTGMTCAACSARVEKAVNKVPGVISCAVSLLTNSMGVEGTAQPSEIIAAVEAAGYGASLANKKSVQSAAGEEDALKDRETPALKRRLITSVVFLVVLMYVSMGHMMWGWPLPAWFNGNHVAMGLLQLLLAAAIMVINQKFFISGFKALWHRSPNMDTLVALGSAAAFVWSVYALFAMTNAVVAGDHVSVMSYMMEFYFESAGTILTLITVGKMLEARSKGRTTDALKGLMKLAAKTAVIVEDGREVTVPIERVKKGDIFVVRPGENIPVDGVVKEGISAVNESALTGESIPVDKTEGNGVSAGTVNMSGFLRCEATEVGEDTTLSRIIKMVSDAAATKAPIAKIADKVSGVFVPIVISIAIVTSAVWLILGREFSFALARGITVLVISCPCALGLATPVAIMVGNGIGAKNGILFKTAVSLEETGKAQIIAMDKTGTITCGAPKVTDIYPCGDRTPEELVSLAYALEKKSEHPLAKAINEYAEQNGTEAPDISRFEALPGNGLCGKMGDSDICGGSLKYISSITDVSSDLEDKAVSLAEEGKTPMLFAENGMLAGMIAVADVIKPDSRKAVSELQNMGIRVVMLTGDNEKTARAIGGQAGVDDVYAGVLPGEKESVIRKLQEQGKVIMVGDGINDAPALTRADIGIAIGAGTDIAIDSADVVLMKSNLIDVPAAIRLSRATLGSIHQNLFWAFIYNIVGIPLAAGVFGLKLDPMFAAAAMSLSSFCVVSNALRLNLFNIRSARRDRKIKAPKAQNGAIEQSAKALKQTLTLHIEGMMCEHCENAIRKALEALPFVESAEADHIKGIAVVKTAGDADIDAMTHAVEEEDYKVLSVE